MRSTWPTCARSAARRSAADARRRRKALHAPPNLRLRRYRVVRRLAPDRAHRARAQRGRHRTTKDRVDCRMKRLYISSATVGIIGFALVWYASNWIVAVGLFLALWSNNVMLKLNKMQDARHAQQLAKAMRDARKQIRE